MKNIRAIALLVVISSLMACDELIVAEANNQVKIQRPEVFFLGEDFACISKEYAMQKLPDLFNADFGLKIDELLIKY